MTRSRSLLALITATVLAFVGLAVPASAADGGHRTTKVFTLAPSPQGNPEGVAWDGHTDRFFVGATGDGTIYRGRLGDRTVRPWLKGAKGRSAVGMKVFHGRLYVAGGTTGTLTVYRIEDRHQVARFTTGKGGFLNDLVVTDRGDVWVTDSFRPKLWHVTADQVRRGHGTVDAINVSPEIRYTAGAFNLNGIVALDGGRRLVVVDTVNGKLFRIVPGRHGHRKIDKVDAPTVVGGDGMIVDRGRLVVVTGSPARLIFLKLGKDGLRARKDEVRTDRTLRGPSTVARADDRYLVVNADFTTSRKPFTVSGLPR